MKHDYCNQGVSNSIGRIPDNFDPELYLIANPDVKSVGMDPASHYIQYGKKEGRALAPYGNTPIGWSYKGITDPEFMNNFIWSADVCETWLNQVFPKTTPLRILDFGCGTGTTALGLALRYGREIVAVDITSCMSLLEKYARQNLGLKQLPDNLKLMQIEPGDDLKKMGQFDAIISWSVFEHVDMQLYPQIIRNFSQILSADGIVFVQIEPLWLSPFGSHLRMFIEEPWAHLLYSNDKIRSMSQVTPKKFQLAFNDTQNVDYARQYLLDEFEKLNHVEADELVRMFRAEGFDVVREERNQVSMVPPECLKSRYREIDLKTNEIRVAFRHS